jgi:hypothetical protein
MNSVSNTTKNGLQNPYNLSLTRLESSMPTIQTPDILPEEKVDVEHLIGTLDIGSPRSVLEKQTKHNYQLIPLPSSRNLKQDSSPSMRGTAYKTVTVKFITHHRRSSSLENLRIVQTPKNATIVKETRPENSNEVLNFFSHRMEPQTLAQILSPISTDFTPISFRGRTSASPRMTPIPLVTPTPRMTPLISAPKVLFKKAPPRTKTELRLIEPGSPKNVFETMVNEAFKQKQPLTSRASPLRIRFKETSGISTHFQLPRVRPVVKKLPELLGMRGSKSVKKYF